MPDILARDFTCAPDGYTVTTFKAGTEVTGRVAEWARQEGALVKRHDPKRRTKRLEGPGEDK